MSTTSSRITASVASRNSARVRSRLAVPSFSRLGPMGVEARPHVGILGVGDDEVFSRILSRADPAQFVVKSHWVIFRVRFRGLLAVGRGRGQWSQSHASRATTCRRLHRNMTPAPYMALLSRRPSRRRRRRSCVNNGDELGNDGATSALSLARQPRRVKSVDRALIALVAALAATLIVFALWPELDLKVARLFYGPHGFLGAGRLGSGRAGFFPHHPVRAAHRPYRRLGTEGARRSSAVGAERAGSAVSRPHHGARAGPIVNVGLKQHAHRPRPVHLVEFGGTSEFKPWYEFDGACAKNCSFASGEAAQAFWMVAPALSRPPAWRVAALGAAFAFGVGASWLRMAFGGHFLSDVAVGGLITLIVIAVVFRLLRPRRHCERSEAIAGGHLARGHLSREMGCIVRRSFIQGTSRGLGPRNDAGRMSPSNSALKRPGCAERRAVYKTRPRS